MELIKLYNQIQNPLDDHTVIEKLVQAYAKSTSSFGGFYGCLTKTVKKQHQGQYYIEDADLFFSMMFNQWKKNVIKMTKERFIELRNNGNYNNDFIRMREFLKTVPDVTTKDEAEAILNGKYDKELSNAFENYSWNSIGAYSGWVHVCSRYVTAKTDEYPKIEHRLYLNTESIDTYKIVFLLVKKMNEHTLPYYFKFDQFGDRDDTIVIYSDSKHLLKYIELLNEIKSEHPDLVARFKNPPILTGKIDGWIGYGSEPGKTPDGKNQSFNDVRSKAIETAINKVTNKWILNHRNTLINYQNKQISFQDYVAMKSTEALLSHMKRKFDYKNPNQTDKDIARNCGYTLSDIQSSSFKNYIYNTIRNKISICLTQVCNDKNKDIQNIEIPLKNGKNITFSAYDLSNTIKELSIHILKQDKNFSTSVKTEIINNSKQYGIDTDKYCFDVRTRENIIILDANQNQTLKSNTSSIEVFKSEINKKRIELNNLKIKKNRHTNEIIKFYTLLNSLKNKNLHNDKYQYEKLSLEIKIQELELQKKVIDIEIRASNNFILQNQLKIDNLERKITDTEFSFKMMQLKLDNTINKNIANLNCNTLRQEILKMKSSLLDYAETLNLIRNAQRLSAQNKNSVAISEFEIENDSVIAKINKDYKEQIYFQILYRFKTKEINDEVRDAQIEALETIKDFDFNTSSFIANISASQVRTQAKK